MGEARYEVLGLPLRLLCTDVRIHSLAEDCLLSGKRNISEAPLELEVEVVGRADPSWPDRPEFDAKGSRFEIRTPDGAGWADQSSGKAFARTCLDGHGSLRDVQTAFLETLALFLAYALRPIILHAAAVVEGGRCVLLAGEEGAGKSTLAYACLRAGMHLLGDDIVYFSPSQGPPFAWGHPVALYLLPNAPTLFPELRGGELVRRLNGEEKLRVDIRRQFPASMVAGHPVQGVLTLTRTPGKRTCIETVGAEEVVQALTRLRGEMPLDRTGMAETARLLADGRCGRLEVGDDPAAAVAVLREWLR